MIFNMSTSYFSQIFISLFWGLFNDESDLSVRYLKSSRVRPTLKVWQNTWEDHQAKRCDQLADLFLICFWSGRFGRNLNTQSLPGVFFSTSSCRWTSDTPQKDLAKSGYKWAKAKHQARGNPNPAKGLTNNQRKLHFLGMWYDHLIFLPSLAKRAWWGHQVLSKFKQRQYKGMEPQ